MSRCPLFLPNAPDADDSHGALPARPAHQDPARPDVVAPPGDYFRTLIQNTPDILTLLAPDGTLLYENAAAERILGWNPVARIGTNRLALVHPEDHTAVETALATALAHGGAPTVVECRLRHQDGSWRTLESMVTCLHDERGPVALLLSSRDITERAQLQAQLRQAQKMEAVGRLAGGVAHDLNNLLTVINGSSELLLGAAAQEDRHRPLLQAIHKAGERATSLTRQLLAFSRKQVLAPQLLNLNLVVSNLEDMLTRLIGENIRLATRLQACLATVEADPGQVEQVLMNLVLNARDAMPTGGDLTIETDNVTFDPSRKRSHPETIPGDYVVLSVTDSGCGMDADTRTRIFEPFFTTKETGKGTGLGLAIVYGIVKQSGGFVYVYSEPGMGSTFKVYLPRKSEPVLAASEQPRPEKRSGSESIVVVEDEDDVRNLVAETLRMSGYTVRDFADGQHALEHSRDLVVDLLVSDVVMPGMGGRELTQRLHELRPQLKVLFMSGYPNDTVVQHGILDQGVNFIQKPFTLSALTWKVRQILDS